MRCAAMLLGTWVSLSSGIAIGQVPREPRDQRVEALLAEMTLEEKAGQMTQLTLQAVSRTEGTATQAHELDPELLRDAIVGHHVGSILNVWNVAFSLDHWSEVITAIQDMATRETRLKVPVLYGVDSVHGAIYLTNGTIFPQQIAMAATWNPELVRLGNEITAVETRAGGIPWNFAPILDIGRQPLWSRFFETFGEDPFLASVLGRAAVEGLQGGEEIATDRVAACAKHFLGYSLPLSGKDRTPAYLPERQLREWVLPPFRAALDAGARTVMVNSGEINGVPVHASKEILTDLLRKELGFDGVAVSDWEDIIKLHTLHRVAESEREAVRMAIEAGLDMSMTPYSLSFHDHLVALVRDGEIPESRLDESVRRILKLKAELGLFEHPYPDPSLKDRVATEENRRVALEAARECVTLLKNDGRVLPLATEAKVLVAGPGATSLPMLHGSWTYTWQGKDKAMFPEGTKTVVEAIQAKIGADRVVTLPDVELPEGASAANHNPVFAFNPSDLKAAVDAADVAIVVLGELPSTEKPGDLDDLALSAPQIILAREIAKSGMPTVLVLLQNRPRLIEPLAGTIPAIVLGYQPGMFGADALADVLFGDVNPSGRLPFTYPRFLGAVVPYDRKPTEDLAPDSSMNAFQPQFEFGHGLSYTSFAYGELTLSATEIPADGSLTVSVTVTNTGDRAGQEVVQLYLTDLYASITPAVKRLKGFEKIALEPGESRVVEFTIGPDALSFIGLENKSVVEPGEFRVSIGGRQATFRVR